MILTTTNTIEGKTITDYRGIVVGEAIMGANVVRDFFAGITDRKHQNCATPMPPMNSRDISEFSCFGGLC